MSDFVVYGLGELGRFYAGGALRAGYRVTPIRRGDDPAQVVASLPAGTPIVVAVGEADLAQAMAALPRPRLRDTVLLQNELFPADWQQLGVEQPTIAVPWLLCKRGMPLVVARPTPLFGPHAECMAAVHEALQVAHDVLPGARELAAAVVAKYAFILTINSLGLLDNCSVGQWIERDASRVAEVTREAVAVGQAVLGEELDAASVSAEVEAGFRGFPNLPSRGRTAPARLARALQLASAQDVAVPALSAIQDHTS